jgi:hypothetical protein
MEIFIDGCPPEKRSLFHPRGRFGIPSILSPAKRGLVTAKGCSHLPLHGKTGGTIGESILEIPSKHKAVPEPEYRTAA